MRTRYLLHGGRTRVPNTLNDQFFQSLQRDVPDGGNVLMVYFARLPEDVPELFNREKLVVAKNAGGKKLHYVLATEDKFVEQVRAADAIFIRGGDTQLLLKTLKQYPDFPQLIKEKAVGGSSAGAYVFATWAFNNDTQALVEGLGILPIRIHAHHAGQQVALNALGTCPHELELVLIPEFETREFVVEE